MEDDYRTQSVNLPPLYTLFFVRVGYWLMPVSCSIERSEVPRELKRAIF
jgi:hypothetical protein